MRCSRTSPQNEWRNIGRNAAKAGIPLESILTGRSFADANIRAGYALGLKRKARKSTTK